MPKPKGSSGFEGIPGERLQACKRLMDECTPDEVAAIRGYASHCLARWAAFEDEPGQRSALGANRCLLAIERADERMREKTGERLRLVREYQEFKELGDPSVSMIYNHFGRWRVALDRSGVSLVSRAEGRLLHSNGRPKGGGTSWTLDQRVRALALAIEDHSGYTVTKLGYEDFRERHWGLLPSYNQVIGAQQRGPATHGLEQMHHLAYPLIAANPRDYPCAHVRVVTKLALGAEVS
jgi:hypothetical protein